MYTRKKNICFLEKLLYFCYNCKKVVNCGGKCHNVVKEF